MPTTIEDLLDKIYWGSGSQAEKGSRFEALMVAYLQTAAEYEGRFSDVKRWQEWEGRQGKADHGIDIVARDAATGGWCAVQCKFYDPGHYLNRPDIDSFLAASWLPRALNAPVGLASVTQRSEPVSTASAEEVVPDQGQLLIMRAPAIDPVNRICSVTWKRHDVV